MNELTGLKVWDMGDLEEKVIALDPEDALKVSADLMGETPESVRADYPSGIEITEVSPEKVIKIVYEDEPTEEWKEFVRKHGTLRAPGEEDHSFWEARLEARDWVTIEGRGYLCGENW